MTYGTIKRFTAAAMWASALEYGSVANLFYRWALGMDPQRLLNP